VPNQVSKITNFSMRWLFNTLVDDYWSQWIKSESAKTTFRKFGYYSEMVNSKLKLIALNSNLCYRMNFWIVYDPYDPDGQLSWLIRELDEAETNGHYVIIIGIEIFLIKFSIGTKFNYHSRSCSSFWRLLSSVGS